MIFAKKFWSNKESSRSKHWDEWAKVCLSREERELGFRSMFDFLRLCMLNCGGD